MTVLRDKSVWLNWHRPVTAFIVVALLASGCFDDSNPLPDPPVEPDAPQELEAHPEITAAELEDLQFIADERGWTLDEAIERIGWQPRLVELVEELRKTYPDTFSGAAIMPDSSFQAFIGFKHDAPDLLGKDARLSQLSIDVREHRGFSEKELHEQLLEAHHSLRAAGVRDVMSSYNIGTGKIHVVMVPQLANEPGGLSSSVMPAAALASNVVVELVDSIPGVEDDLFGGGRFEVIGTVDRACTAGVMVRGSGMDGMLTAGHCPDAMSLENTNGAVEHIGLIQGQHFGARGDFQWHTFVTDDPSHRFYFDTGVTREAWAVRSTIDGQTLCRFGQTTGRQCDEVKKINVSSGGADRLVMMKNREADGGDSGGPWYYGNNVYGIHHGAKWSFPKLRDLFSQLTNVGIALGVSVVLCQPWQNSCNPGDCGTIPIGCGRTMYCGVCGGCQNDSDCSAPNECSATGGLCRQGFCLCF